MDDSPKEPRPWPTTSPWTRRITMVALVVLLILSGLRLVNSLLRNADSVIFPFVPRFPWDVLVYSALEFVLVLIVLIVADRELRVRRPARRLVSPPKGAPPAVKTPALAGPPKEGPPAVKAPAPPPPRPAKAKKPEPVYYTITGEEVNPTEQEGDSSPEK